jgi:hypothetical protein
MKKALGSLLLAAALNFSVPCLAQETTKPDTVKLDKNKDQITPPKSESTNEAPKKAEPRDSVRKDSIPQIKNAKVIERRKEENKPRRKKVQK